MAEDSHCPNCGAPVLSSAPSGQCPACLFRIGLELGGSSLLKDADQADPAEDMPERVRYFGDYELIEEIGRGGMGVVYRARQVSLNRLVALKMIRAGELANETEVARFRAEAEAAANLDHPGIVPIYEVGEHAGRHYYSMKLVEGGSLAQALANDEARMTNKPLKRGGARFDLCHSAFVISTIARAVHYAHQRGILHRDLKPGNILLNANGEPFVTDFGLARRLEADSELTRTGTALGSPSYMAPEQARGDAKQLTTAADIYSLGAILYELLTGRPPFKGTNVIETMREVVEKAPERPRLLNPNVDGDLETICLKCLEKEPAHRYASAEALAEDLARWLEGKPIHARPNTAWERTVKFVRRKPAIASLAAVSCIAAAALIGIGLAQVAFRAEQNQRKQTEAALKEATRQHGEAEKQRQVAEGLERLRVEDAQVRLEMQRVDAWLTAEEDDYALAYLAKVAERFPSNALVAERVLDELSKRQMPSVLLGPMGVGSACCFSPDDETMAVRGGPGEVRLINLRSGKPTHDLTLPSQASDPLFIIGQRPCAFSKDGDLLITLDPMLSAQLWNVRTGEPVGASFKLTQPPREIHLLQGGRRLAANAGSECSLWDCASGKRLNAWRFPSQVGGNWTIRFSPDERMMALSSVMYAGTPPTRQLQLIDLENGLSMSTNSLSGQIMEFSPQGDLLAVASATELVFLETPSLQVRTNLALKTSVGHLRFTPSGDGVLASFHDGGMQLWNLPDLKSRFTIGASRSTPDSCDIQFSADGLRFITFGRNENVRVFHSNSGGEISLPLQHRQPVARAWFSRDSERLFTVTGGGLLRVWDATTLPPPKPRPQVKVEIVFGSVPLRVEPKSPPQLLKLWGDEPIPRAIPNWIPRFLEAMSGLRINNDGHGEFATQDRAAAWRERLAGLRDPDLYERFARFAVTPESIRPNTPFTSPGRTVEGLIRENTPESIRQALWLDPSNGLAFARHAKHVFHLPNWPSSAGVDYETYSRRAVTLAPDDPEVWLTRIEILRKTGRPDQSLATAIEATGKILTEPLLQEAKSLALESVGRYEEALRELEVAWNLAARNTAAYPIQEGRYQMLRAKLLRSLGRESEAREADARERTVMKLWPGTNDWPAWGGSDPGRNMYSSSKGLPDHFDPGRFISGTEEVYLPTTRNVRWVAKLGSQSYGNVVVSGGRIFVGTNNETPRDSRHEGDRSILMCFEEKAGQFLWQLVVPKLKSGKVNDWENLGMISSPAVVGDRLYVVTSRAEVLCLDVEGMANGNDGPFLGEADYVVHDLNRPPVPPGLRDADIIWRYDMIDELGVFPHNASASSPLVVGDAVFVNTGNGMDWTHKHIPSPLAPTLIALDRRTGQLLGEDDAKIGPRILHGSWSSPSAGMINGRQLIFFSGPDGWCYAFDPKPVPGADDQSYLKTVWKADCNPTEYRAKDGNPIRYPAAGGISEIIATPVFYKNRVYVATGQDPEHGEGVGNLVCIDATKTGDITETGILWRNKTIHRSMSAVSIDPETGLLFISDFSGFVHCLDSETGATHWTHDLRAHVWPGGTMVADGKVYIGDEDGDFTVLPATKDKRLISECNLNAPIYGTPVAANGVLYMQTTSHLYAIQDLGFGTAVASEATK